MLYDKFLRIVTFFQKIFCEKYLIILAKYDTMGLEETEKGMETMEKVLHVEGMMCAHCKAHVEKALLGVNGVTAAEADVENKRAVVQYTGEVSDEALVSAVKEAGYEAKMA